MGREADQVSLKTIEFRTTLRNELSGVAMEPDATGTAGPSNLGNGLKCTDLTLGSNQRNHASGSRQKLLQKLQTDHTSGINGPERNAPPLVLQLIRSGQNSRMFHPRQHNPTRGKGRCRTKNCEMNGLSGA